jgi:hypothetical protein
LSRHFVRGPPSPLTVRKRPESEPYKVSVFLPVTSVNRNFKCSPVNEEAAGNGGNLASVSSCANAPDSRELGRAVIGDKMAKYSLAAQLRTWCLRRIIRFQNLNERVAGRYASFTDFASFRHK